MKIITILTDIGNELIGNELTSFACSECEIGTAGVLENSKCADCTDIDGIFCLGGSNLIISYNYWTRISSESVITSHFCPSGYCCQNINGCNYTNLVNEQSGLCAYGRDTSSPLCGACLDGYSGMFLPVSLH